MDNQNKKSIKHHLDTLVEVLMDNFIFYIPSEIMFEGVIDAMEGELPDQFFDELSFYDHKVGIYLFDNSDVLEVNQKLLNKKAKLDLNTQNFLELTKSISEDELIYLYNEYVDRLLFFIYISTWLCEKLQQYNKDLHVAILGAFKLQLAHLQSHLKDLYNYFGELLALDLNEAYTTEAIVTKYFQDIIFRIHSSTEDEEDEEDEEKVATTSEKIEKPRAQPQVNTVQKKKKQKPQIDEQKLEEVILSSVFNVEIKLQ